jgi:uncharacterized protein HemY
VPLLLLGLGAGLLTLKGAGDVVTATGEVVKQPAVIALGAASVIYALALLIREVRR